ncbi:hypothetical protein [Leptospira stimsonii]|uniref:Uncharacterized protein n=1 Tax=Leptospira stimsonii TaxID=2202203 RepID=A0A8B3CHN9_9LEPT|nr:hypothetical protein [Leptospira stimsonii]RHX83226.1 hypothetical protein DLM78_22220 [Leptospira stimsonii]
MRILEPNKRVVLNIKYENNSFKFEADIADPSTELDIEIAVAKRLNGASLESIPNSTYGYIYAIATLNHVIKEIPEDFPITDIQTFEQIRDKEFVIKLFKEYEKKENWFKSELKKNRDARRTERRRESSRPLSNEPDEHTPERSNTSGKFIPRTKEIHPRGDGQTRHSESSNEGETEISETPSSENETEGIPGEYKPGNGKYPGGRGRVFTRHAEE